MLFNSDTCVTDESSRRPQPLRCHSKSQFSLNMPDPDSHSSLDSLQSLLDDPTLKNKTRIVSIYKARDNSTFGAQVTQLNGLYYVTCVRKYDDFGYLSGAYRAGLSFADRILSINQLEPESILDVQAVLDNNRHLTIMFEQQPDLVHAWVPLKNGRLRGMTTHGLYVGKVCEGSVAHRSGVRQGHSILAIDRQCVLGMSDEVVNMMIWKRTGSMRPEVQLTLINKVASRALLDCLKVTVWVQRIQLSVSDYVTESLELDKPLYKVDVPSRIKISNSLLFHLSNRLRLWRRVYH